MKSKHLERTNFVLSFFMFKAIKTRFLKFSKFLKPKALSALLGGNTMKANLRKKKPLQVLWHIVKVTHFSNFILSFVCYLFLAALILLFTEPAIETFGDSIWYSFVTSTTTGYGDIVVTTAIGRIVSVILSLYGLLFFGCLSGIVVTYYMEMNKLLPKEEDQK